MFANSLNKRININHDISYSFTQQQTGLKNMKARLDTRGGTDQWVRMRQDKLRSLKKALLYSYQKAIVQKYNVQNETLILNIETIIHLMEVQEDYTEYLEILQQLESEYDFLDSQERGSAHYIEGLNNIIASLSAEEPLFRCLINHDKLKVDYEDKIISIPFQQVPINGTEEIWTTFHNSLPLLYITEFNFLIIHSKLIGV